MRRRIARFLAAVGFLATTAAGWGEELDRPTLFAACRAMRLDVVLGRLVVTPYQGGQLRLESDPGSARTESLAVNNSCAAPWVRYEWQDDQQTGSLDIHKFRDFSARCESRTAGEPRRWEFQQPETGDVRLVLHEGDKRREVAAPGFWHLLLAERRLCEETLLPLLLRLRTDWQVRELAERIEMELFRRAFAERDSNRRDIMRLVTELDAPQFQRRQLAARRLRALGPAVIPHLEELASLDRAGQLTWSSEQRARVRQILESLAAPVPDTPDRVAEWLAEDEHIWLALLKDHDPQRRHVASLRLSLLHPDQIQFDPYGDESYRQAQMAQLRIQLNRR